MAPTLLLSTAAALCCLSLVSSTDYETENHGHKKPHQTNLLFIMFDDLRAELSIYGKSGIISPNFERLAARSVVFDNAYCQISVCNPSRDSLLTGLRPDTVGTYGFQSSYGTYKRHLLLPTRLKRSGYTTAGYGKIRHWDGGDGSVWSENYNGNWYGYQGEEWNFMNSSVMPDKVRAEETFPDYIFASKAIEGLQRLSKLNEYFMVSVGFKMPHLAMHVPYKYYDMYRSRVHQWNATEAELRYPLTSPVVSYRCCADSYHYMNDEGALKSNRTYETRHINDTFPLTVHQEMMWGYAAMVTFVDKQLGRVLDAVDELELWGNLTVVLTSDHGMHNGEKGIWCVCMYACVLLESCVTSLNDFDIMHVAAATDLLRSNTSPWNNIPALLIRVPFFYPRFALLALLLFRFHALTLYPNHVGKSGHYSMKARTSH